MSAARARGASVLVLDGQTTQALACVRSLGRAGHRVLLASDRKKPLSAWSRYCQEHLRLTNESVTEFAALRTWARDRGVTVVLPVTERSCRLVNAERDEWERAGIIVGCGVDEMLLQAFDKARTVEIAAACDVRVPPTLAPQSIEECRAAGQELGFPCIVKSRFSSAWDGEQLIAGTMSYVRSAADLDQAVLLCRQGAHWPIIQGFVEGRGTGVFALVADGRVITWFAHERLRDVRPSGSGSSLRRSIPLSARLRLPAERLLAALAWRGPVMVELRDDGGDAPCLMEVNGRFWGSLELAVSAGVDFPRLWVEVLTGQPVEPPSTYEHGVTLRWIWGDVKRLLYIAAGPPPGFPGAYPSLTKGLAEVLGPQPSGTRSETWDREDRWPALGEWIQGVGELARFRRPREALRRRNGVTPTPEGDEETPRPEAAQRS